MTKIRRVQMKGSMSPRRGDCFGSNRLTLKVIGSHQSLLLRVEREAWWKYSVDILVIYLLLWGATGWEIMFDVGSHEVLQTKDGLCLDFGNRKRFKQGRLRYILKKEYTLAKIPLFQLPLMFKMKMLVFPVLLRIVSSSGLQYPVVYTVL